MDIMIKNNLLENLREAIREKACRFSKGEKIAIKAHLGEYGNLNYIRPPIIECIVSVVKKTGAKPFIFDTPSWYEGGRHDACDYIETARKNGFTQETMGCPIIISDESVRVPGKEHLDHVNVSKQIHDADGMIVVSHVKGHMCASYGGAIKNLGMGAVDRQTKEHIHKMSMPKVVGGCSGCRICADECKVGAISFENGVAVIDHDACYGCCVCAVMCPNKAIIGDVGLIQKLLAESACAVLEPFDKDKLLFVNVMLGISERCDCATNHGAIICNDVGILVSDNIVAADRCAIDLVNKSAGCDIFRNVSRLDPGIQIESAIQYGLGSGEYELKVIE